MRGPRIVWILVGLSLIVFASVFVIHGFTEASTRLNIRLSARLAFLAFWMAFIASSVQFFFRNQFGFWILANRKFFGISFGIIHLIHLALLALLQLYFHPVFQLANPISLAGGGIAYLFVVLMLITSFQSAKDMMPFKAWEIIHTLGMYWIAAVFLTSYGKRSLTDWEYIPLLSLLVFGFILRLLKVISPFGRSK